MRPSERDALLILLSVCAGSADGWSFMGLGHAFVANMTGNTVLVGLAIFRVDGDLLHPLLSLICYCAGVAFGAFVTRKIPAGRIWPRLVSSALLIEAVMMGCAEVEWVIAHGYAPHPPSAPTACILDVLLGVIAFAVGIQSGLMLQLRIPGVVTTYITGTWTNLISGFIAPQPERHLVPMKRGFRLRSASKYKRESSPRICSRQS